MRLKYLDQGTIKCYISEELSSQYDEGGEAMLELLISLAAYKWHFLILGNSLFWPLILWSLNIEEDLTNYEEADPDLPSHVAREYAAKRCIDCAAFFALTMIILSDVLCLL